MKCPISGLACAVASYFGADLVQRRRHHDILVLGKKKRRGVEALVIG